LYTVNVNAVCADVFSCFREDSVYCFYFRIQHTRDWRCDFDSAYTCPVDVLCAMCAPK